MHFLAHVYGGLDALSFFGFPTTIRLDSSRFRDVLATVRQAIAEFDSAEPGCTLAVNGACAGMISLLWREAQNGGSPVAPSKHAAARDLVRLAPVFRLVAHRYGDPLTLQDLADAVHLTPSYFSSLFSEATGVSPMRYLAAHRLREARQRLLATPDSVAEIAVATGFRDPFYFSRVFKAADGISPSEYRRAQGSPSLP